MTLVKVRAPRFALPFLGKSVTWFAVASRRGGMGSPATPAPNAAARSTPEQTPNGWSGRPRVQFEKKGLPGLARADEVGAGKTVVAEMRDQRAKRAGEVVPAIRRATETGPISAGWERNFSNWKAARISPRRATKVAATVIPLT